MIISNSTSNSEYSSSAHYPVVQFQTIKGDTLVFRSGFGSYPPKYYKGQEINVLYQPDNPAKARIDDQVGNYLFVIIFGGMGLIFFLIGAILWGIVFKQKLKRSRLDSDGQSILAEIIGIERDLNHSRNGIHPYYIEAQWQHPESRLMYIFRSDPIWYDPGSFTNRQHIAVKINYEKPSQYHMDISFLPPSADTVHGF